MSNLARVIFALYIFLLNTAIVLRHDVVLSCFIISMWAAMYLLYFTGDLLCKATSFIFLMFLYVIPMTLFIVTGKFASSYIVSVVAFAGLYVYVYQRFYVGTVR